MSLKDRLSDRIASAEQKAESDNKIAEDRRKSREKEQYEANVATALALVSEENVERMLNIAIDNHLGRKVVFALTNGTLSPVRQASPSHLQAMDQFGFDFKSDPYVLTFDKATSDQQVLARIQDLRAEGISIQFLSNNLGQKPIGIVLDYTGIK